MNTGLLIIDAQKGFSNEYTKNVIENIKLLRKKLPHDVCIYTKFYNSIDSGFVEFLNWERLMTEDEQSLLIKVENNDFVIDKDTYSGLTEDVKKIVYRNNISKMYVCGVDTDSCVLATAFDLFDNEVQPVIIIDCCASTGGVNYHNAAEIIMRRCFGEENVIKYNDIIGEII